MKHIKLSLLCFFILSLLAISPAQAQNPVNGAEQDQNDIRLKQILSTGVAYNGSIIQDSDGFFWIATQAGLYKYDGSEVKVYDTSNSPIKGARIQTVFEDREGNIWFTTQGAGAYRYEKNTDTFTTYLAEEDNPNSISDNTFNWSPYTLAQDAEGHIWIGSVNGLNRFDPETNTFTHYKSEADNAQSLSNNDVWAVLEDSQGVLWIGTADGLNRYDKATETFTVYKDEDYEATTIYALHEDSNGTLWVGTAYNSLANFNKTSGHFTYYNQADYPFTVVSSISEYQDRLWLAHWPEVGLSSFSPQTQEFTIYTTETQGFGLEDDAGMHTYVDQRGRLWIITFSVIHNYDRLAWKFEYFDRPTNNPENQISKVLNIIEDNDGHIWLGTFGEGLFKYDPQTDDITQYLPDPDDPTSLPDNSTASLLIDSNGEFWVGSEGALSLVDVETGQVQKVLETPEFALLHLLEDKENPDVIWGSLFQGGLVRINKETGEYKHYQNNPADPTSLGSNFFLHMYQEPDGTFWLATSGGGLERFDKEQETFTHYKSSPDDPHSIGNNTVNGITVASSGAWWLASEAGGGLIKFNPATEQFNNLNTTTGLFPTDNTAYVIPDEMGNLWVSTSDTGIIKFNPDTLEYKVYGADEGVMPGQFWASSGTRAGDGAIYFGGLNGFNKFYPAEIKDNPFKPPVYLTSLKQGGEEMDINRSFEKVEQIELNWQENYFEFEFVALNYTLPEKNQYQYILKGFDKEWYHSGRRRFGRYSGLDEGMYILKIRGTNNDGLWSDQVATLNVYVEPTPEESVLLFSLDDLKNGEPITLNHDQNTFSLEVAPLDFDILENGKYAYILEGYDDDWVSFDNDRYVRYTNVPQGEYVFKVTDGSQLTVEKSLAITPPWWKTTWFIGLLGSTFLIGVGGVLLIVGSQIRAQQALRESRLEAAAAAAQAQAAEAEAQKAAAMAQAQAATAQAQAERATTMKALNTISQQLTGILNLERLLDQVVMLTKETFDYYHVHIYLLNEARDTLVLAEGYGQAGAEMKAAGHTIPVNHPTSLSAQAAREGYSLILSDVRDEPGWQPPALLPDVQAKIAVPIIQEDETVGVMTVYSKQKDGLDEADTDLLQSLANQVAIAMTNASLFEQTRQARAEAEEARAIADQASQAKSDFLSSMSHELRTPLNGILGYTQILKRSPDLTASQQEGLNVIHQSGEHLLTLITDILDLSKIEAGKLELYPRDFNLADFLSSVSGLIRIRAQNQVIGFALNEVPPLPEAVQGDEKRLRQVLINLLNNAVKFTEEGGSVTLRVMSIAMGKLSALGDEVAQAPADDGQEGVRLRFEVIDTGVGMTEAELKRIFQPFEQVGDIRKRAEGTGLGLSITRRLLALMGSSLQVESEPGQGSTFWFEVLLPEAEAVAPVVEKETSPEVIGYRGAQKTVLVVDDKTHNRAVLLNILAPLGFKVLQAEGGRAGIELARAAQPDIVIMDMIMPDMTGFEAVQRMREIPQFEKTVIFGASASVFEEDRQQVQLTGCDAFLAKPVTVKRLLTLLEEHLGLEWVYKEEAADEIEPEPSEAPKIVPPPAEALAELYQLARRGNMRKIRQWADRLMEQDEQYRPFAHQVQELARRFQKKQILALVERYMSQQED